MPASESLRVFLLPAENLWSASLCHSLQQQSRKQHFPSNIPERFYNIGRKAVGETEES
jgi:hypothetical protein